MQAAYLYWCSEGAKLCSPFEKHKHRKHFSHLSVLKSMLSSLPFIYFTLFREKDEAYISFLRWSTLVVNCIHPHVSYLRYFCAMDADLVCLSCSHMKGHLHELMSTLYTCVSDTKFCTWHHLQWQALSSHLVLSVQHKFVFTVCLCSLVH